MCDKPYTSSDKWTVAFTSGLLFLLLASPYTYTLTDRLSEKLGADLSNPKGCPNVGGLLVHAAIYMVIIRLLMNKSNNGCLKPYTSKDKWIVALMGGLLFTLLSSPFFYQALNNLTSFIKFDIASSDGCPNLAGLIFTTILFIGIVRLLMR
jgi:hypothetical protein